MEKLSGQSFDKYPSPPKSALLLGLGSRLRGDDAIGLEVAESLRNLFLPFLDIVATEEMGLAILDFISGYRELYVVDSLVNEALPPGRVVQVPLQRFSVLLHCSCHGLGLPEVLALGKQMGIPVPEEVTIYAVVIHHHLTIQDHLSPSLQKQLPIIAAEIAGSIARKNRWAFLSPLYIPKRALPLAEIPEV